jgi:hypothetical protein
MIRPQPRFFGVTGTNTQVAKVDREIALSNAGWLAPDLFLRHLLD